MDRVAQVRNVVVCLCVVDSALLRGGVAAVAASVVATGSAVKPHLELVVAVLSKLYALRQEHLLGILVGVFAVAVLLAPVWA